MKKISIFLMLLMGVLLPWAASAQTTDLLVNDGTATNNYIPFYGSYVDTQGCTCEFVIPATTVGMDGMTGGTISKLTFYISGSPATWGSPTIQVYMGEVSGTTLSGINGPTNFTTVYTGTISNQTNPLVIELTNAYTYGGGNLLIGTYVQTASSTYKSTPFYGVSAASGSSYYHSGSSYGSATAQSFLPKTTITYTPNASYCAKPTNLHKVGEPGPRNVTVAWDAEAGDSFQYAMVSGHNIDPTTVTAFDGTTSTGEMTWNTLTPDSDYTVVLRRDCGSGNYSQAVSLEFHTDVACPAPTNLAVVANTLTARNAQISWTGYSDSYTVQTGVLGQVSTVTVLSEGFESGSMPTGWSRTGSYWQITSGTSNSSYTGAATGSYNAGCYIASYSDSDILVTPAIDLSTAASATLNFKFWNTAWGSDVNVLNVYYRVDGGNWNLLYTNGQSNSGWTAVPTITLEGLAANYQIGFECQSNYSYGMGVDDVEIVAQVASITWANVDTNASNPFNFNNTLSPETTYRVRVIGDCSGTPSNPSEVLTFTTPASCPMPTNLQVTTDGATATVTWDGGATCNVNFGGTIYPSQTSGCSFPVQVSTTYTVAAETVCSGETSGYCTPVSITTPPCVGGHTIEYTLTDSYDDGWEGSSITIIEGCGDVFATLTCASGESPKTGTLTLCGDYYQFVYTQGSYPSEYGWTFTEGGSTIFSGAGNGSSDGQVLYTIGTQIAIPTALTEGTITKNSVELGWTENGTATAWEICVNGDETHPVPANTNPFTLGSLTPDTDYTIKVRAYIDATHQSCWSDEITIHTDIACARPESLTASNVTANSIDLSWTGNHEKYDVRYIETLPTADFEEGLGAWTTIDADGDGFTWLWSANASGMSGNNSSSNCVYSQSYDNDGGQALTPNNYLVSPKVQLGGRISFYAKGQDPSFAAENFGVAVSTTGNTNAADFTMVMENETATGDWVLYTVDLSAYSGEGYVAIRHYGMEGNDQFYLDVDDITITVPETAAWNYKNNLTSNRCTLDNLAGSTTYAIQVRGYCQGETDPSNWTEAIMETTINGNVFIAAGDWNVASNWQGNAVPAAGSDVIIAANVTVPASYVADAGTITFENSPTITVADGGQLKTTSSGIQATMQKTITGYGSANAETKLGYYLLANPVIDNQDPSTLGMTTGNYDLYYFDLNCDGTYGDYGAIETQGTDGLEWRNYETNAFDLVNGQGYLYANEATLNNLAFTGELNPTNANIKVLMHYDASAEFPGMNLLGNPYTCNAYIADGRAFYVMDPVAGDIVTGSGAIAPMQGVFVEASAVGNLNFTTTAPANNDSKISINVLRQNALVDRAVVNFGEGQGLSKFQLNRNHTKIYMPVEGKDYAVVYTEEQGVMPVNFKAENNGTYTLSFTTEEVSFAYLHLIDNMTGNDVDLLATPSYSFNAKTTDYESRFKLVFATGNNSNNDTFAFYSNGSFVINNEGEATLQVIDINGRILKSKSINGCANVNVNAAQGIYMLRLVNGDSVKVQKVVVR